MSDKKGRPRRSDRPESAVAAELKQKRDAFLHTFFKRGAELTDELVHENKKLRDTIAKLEEDNASLKTQLASDRAIRDALRKIEDLEREKSRLLSSMHEQEEITGKITNRFAEVESELESFANLYVASFQLHISLGLPTVMRHVKELLVQLVGAKSLAVYFVDEARRKLEPIASDGVDLASVPAVPVQDGAPGNAVAAAIERAFLTGVPHVADGDVRTEPAACIPLHIDDRNVGVVVVYALLEQKRRFLTVDRELFKLLGAHAAGAIVGAFHHTRTDGKLPTPEELRAITG
ncbi:MAG TPA: GAF domain-containing protein [Polyangiaceae bacterium]